MTSYGQAAVERAMKIQEVILRAVAGKIHWFQAAEILGISPRQMHRWKRRYEEFGYDGLFDHRHHQPSPKRVPLAQVEQVLQLYGEQYADLNVRHFHEKLREVHAIRRSYSWVKKALQEAGLVRRARRRGTYRRRRERRPLRGMLLHMDASRHQWVPAPAAEMHDLLTVSDDATGEVYYGALVPEESTLTVFAALHAVLTTHGLFCALYTDRARHFVYTPRAGEPPDRRYVTQVERALQQLGIELIAAHSPQARGRKERLYRTLQGRLPQEFRLRGLTTVTAANTWLAAEGWADFNRRFAVAPAQRGSAFVPAPRTLEYLLSVQYDRVIAPDHTVRLGNQVLQLPRSLLRASLAGSRVTVHRHLDTTLSVRYGPHTVGRFNAEGQSLEGATLLGRGNGARRGPQTARPTARLENSPRPRVSHISTAPDP
jgi:transposase